MNLTTWGCFYAIVGSCAGGLIGLQFVVISLIASSPNRIDTATINAFGTPIVVNFSSVLTICAILSAPWPSAHWAGITIAVAGVTGIAYSLVVFRRAGTQSHYKPVGEDWVWFVILPSIAYVVLAVGGVLLSELEQLALFIIAGAALALLLIGVRDAWDTVVHIVSQKGQG